MCKYFKNNYLVRIVIDLAFVLVFGCAHFVFGAQIILAQCSNECPMLGARQCVGNGYQVCMDYDQNGCFEWGAINSCSSGQICSAGSCIGTMICSPGSVSGCRVCDTFGTAWVDDSSKCASGQICSAGGCVANTTNLTDNDSEELIVSQLSPLGAIYAASTNLTAHTNKFAYCRYDYSDKSFDSMIFAFSTGDYVNHSAAVKLPAPGAYVYYVRCRDNSGKVNSTVGIISFSYVSYEQNSAPDLVKPNQLSSTEDKKADSNVILPLTDLMPPVISRLLPSGEINQKEITISCATDEPALCKYDAADTDYDSMKNLMEGEKTSHSKKITLYNFGGYNYYVRCRDQLENKNLKSSKIAFEYMVPQFENTPEIFDLLPSGVIYQEEILLTLKTGRGADCRYDLSNIEFAEMDDGFESADGIVHQAAVSLNRFGNYIYYVRCKDKNGEPGDTLALLSFEYADPELKIAFGGEAKNNNGSIRCVEYIMDESDGSCVIAQDCLCDPDCGQEEAAKDSDCANLALQESERKFSINWKGVIVVFCVSLAIISLIVIISIIKGAGGGMGKPKSTSGSF